VELGFVDGISQPALDRELRRTRRRADVPSTARVLALGEVLLDTRQSIGED
jgi:hypothetical protein